ncbi:T9SS type A sorting domain-containing protein [Cryomorphaceae bacterium 1068]|nr:T9SS type A sorting domain-containing protein [Cryomorphaceae bacterium 1068]
MTTMIRAASLSFFLFFTCFISNAQSNDLIDLEFGTVNHFDVATWNIEWFPKNGETTIEYVVEIIEELELDVIAIQEIDEPEQFEYLLSLLQGYDGYYQDGEYARLGFIYNTQSVTVNEQYEIFDNGSYGNPFPRPPLVMELTFMGEHDFVVINNHFKCCGNTILDPDDFWDEETRRAYASELLKDYMDFHFGEENLIMLGDLNDLLTDAPQNNVFQVYIDDPTNYRFADMDIAMASPSQWSYPSWPSHLDHILVSDELFAALEDPESQITTIQIDDLFPGGFNGYDSNVSDHLPVGFGFDPSTTTLSDGLNNSDANIFSVYPNPSKGLVQVSSKGSSPIEAIRVFDQMGRMVFANTNQGSAKNSSFDLSQLPAGIYSISLTTASGDTATKKLVLSR